MQLHYTHLLRAHTINSANEADIPSAAPETLRSTVFALIGFGATKISLAHSTFTLLGKMKQGKNTASLEAMKSSRHLSPLDLVGHASETTEGS